MRWELKKYLKAGVSVTLALILSMFLASDVTSDMLLSLIGGNADFEVSDFYNRIDAGRHEKTFNQDIIVVNVDKIIQRDSIALLIEKIAACNPAVVGIDILFRNPKDAARDSMLIDVFVKNQDKIVTGIALYGDGEESSTYIDENILLGHLPEDNFGVVNLVAVPGGIVRSFIPNFPISTNFIPSFSAVVASRNNPNLKSEIVSKGNDEIQLRYSNEKFLCIEPAQVYEEEYDLRDKIVLVGTLSDAYDMHPTPIDMAYPGVLIHAQIITTILSGSYMSTAGNVLNKVIAIVLAFLLCLVYIQYDSNNAQNLILRLLLIAVVSVGIIIGCVLYSKFNIYINVIFILLVITLSQLVLDIWYGMEEIVKKIKLKSKSKLALTLLIICEATFASYSQDCYKVYDVKGTVTSLDKGHSLSKGCEVALKEKLEMSKNRELTIEDSKRGKLYISESQKNTTVEDIITAAKRQSQNMMKRIYSEMVANIHKQDNQRNATSGKNIGASLRENGEEINANTEYIFSYISGMLHSDENVNREDECETIISLKGHKISDGVVWWSIHNEYSKPLYFNVLQVSKEGVPPCFIYDSDVDMPSMAIEVGNEVELSQQYFLSDGYKYVLVASELPFDSSDINRYFEEEEKPLPLNEFEEIEAKVYCVSVVI